MEYIAQAKDYWIAPQAVKITLNALGNPHRTQATVASGAVIMCYIKGVDGLEYDNGHQYRAWSISASPTYFNTATKKYVYAAIPRSSEVGVQAVIVYPSEMLDIYGCNEDGDQVGSEHFYYIWLQGVISESAYNRANRYWLTEIDYGILSTDEARDDQSYNTDWYTFNAVTQTVTFLKEIIMKAGSSFRNLILGGKELTGVATGDTSEDIDSDTLVVTPNYIRNKFLHKDRDDTTPYSLTIEQELRVGNRGIMNHLQSTDYTGDGMLDSGYKLWYEEGRAKLVIDDLVARGKFTVNELETRIWTYAGGNMVFSGAGSTIFYVEYLDANDNALGYTYINQPWLLRGRALLAASLSWSKRRQIQRQLSDTERAAVVKFRCYEFSDDGTMQTRNWWRPNDIAMCQTMNKVREKQNSDGSYSGSASNTVYKRRIAGIGSKEIPMLNDGRIYDYVDMWNIYDVYGQTYINSQGQTVTITDSVKGFQNMAPSGATPSTDWPAAGDVIVQMGNPLDTDRQAAVTIEVQGEGIHGFKVYDTINDYSLDNDLWVEIGYSPSTKKAKMNVYGDAFIGARDNSCYVKFDRGDAQHPAQLDIKANVRFMSPTSPQQETTLDSFASAVVGDLSNLQSQIDGQILSWFYNYSPVHVDSEGVPDSNVPLNVAPYSDWTTDALKIAHLGDTFTNNKSGYCWRFSRNATTNAFEWVIIEDSAVIKALQDAARAQDTADHKRRVFTAQPTPPYDAGDLWVNVTYPANYTGETDESQHKYKNEILKCITSKPLDTDTFSINDWSLSNGYTSKLNNFVTNTYAPFAQNIQTQVDKKAETYRQATNPALSWDEADKPSHVGDIWMDISANGGKKTYIYQNTAAAGQTPVYDWVAQEVPDEVFDEIDGKTAIYVGWNDWVVDNVSQLNDKDLFIPAADVTPTGSSVTYYANKVYRWDATNSTWNEVAYTDDTYAHGFDYLKAAMKGDTQIQGGLLLSNTIVLRNLNGTTPTDIMAGMNGILKTDLTDPKKSIAAWYGGDMVDLEDLTHYWTAQQIAAWEALTPEQKAASVLVAKSLDRFDGSGYRASGNISWNAAGDLTIKGQVVTATTKIDTPAIFLNGTDITATLNAILGMFELDTTTEPGTTLIKAKYSLYSVGDISAMGQSSGGGGGGGGGASVLYELNDVLANAGGTSVLDAQAGYVLTCVENGGSLKWKAAPTAPTYVLPQATSGALGGIKIGYTEANKNYAVQLDNAGKAYVNVPWTDHTYTIAGLMGSTAIGGTTQPIYWNGSAFVGTTYTLGKSVPANAVFTDHYDWSDITNKPSLLQKLAWWNSGDTHDVDTLFTGITFAYSTQHNAPTTGTIAAFSCSNNGYTLQIQGSYTGDTLYFRNYNGDNHTWRDWKYVIHSGNIGSQSVNYATSAGKAANDGDGNTISSTYLKLIGGTLTGALTLKGSQYGGYMTGSSKTYAQNANNSDIVGVNALIMADKSDGWTESIGFPRDGSDAGHYDTFRAANGTFYFGFNGYYDSSNVEHAAAEVVTITGGTIKLARTDANNAEFRVKNSGRDLSLFAGATNIGLYYNTGSKWILGTNGTDTWLSTGNVGIGTDSPSQKLHVSGGLLAVTNNSRTVTIGAQNSGAIHIYNDNSSGFYFNGSICANSSAAYDLGSTSYPWRRIYFHEGSFVTAKSTYLDLVTNGNEMCIGAGSSNDMYINYRASNGTKTVNNFIWKGGSSSTWASHQMGALTVNGDIYATGGTVKIDKSTAVDTYFEAKNSNGSIELQVGSSGNRGVYDGTGGTGGTWVIATNGTNTWLSKGNVGIGTTSPSYKLHVSGDIYATGDVTAASDERQKCDIEQIDLRVEQIANAPAVKFSWKDGRDNLRHVGSFAQYWQKVLPESVTDKNDILGLNYGSAALVSVVKVAKEVLTHEEEIEQLKKWYAESQDEIKAQKQRIRELEHEVEQLKSA